MGFFGHIVVGTDLSQQAQSALQEGIRLALLHEARLSILHAVDQRQLDHLLQSGTVPANIEQELHQEAQQALHQQSAGHEELADKLETHVLRGHPLEAMMSYCEEHNADVLLIGQTGHSNWEKLLLGNTAQRLLRSMKAPVWVVHQEHQGPLQRIAVGVDLSEPSRAALQHAIHLAKEENATLHVLHVHELLLTPPYIDLHALLKQQGHQLRSPEELQALFEAFLEPVDWEGVTYHTVQKEGHAHEELLRFAEAEHIDLLVMGSIGRSGLASLMLGNTAERVAQKMPCSILVSKANVPTLSL